MKEAMGELNTTVIVVISVGVLSAFFFSYIWPMINNNFQSNSQCSKATCDCSKEVRDDNEGYCLCHVGDSEEFRCVYKG